MNGVFAGRTDSRGLGIILVHPSERFIPTRRRDWASYMMKRGFSVTISAVRLASYRKIMGILLWYRRMVTKRIWRIPRDVPRLRIAWHEQYGFCLGATRSKLEYQAESGRGSPSAVACGTKCRVGYNNMFRRPM